MGQVVSRIGRTLSCFCLIFANMLSLSLSSGAVVTWDAFNDLGNYFLMLWMSVGPPTRPDFALFVLKTCRCRSRRAPTAKGRREDVGHEGPQS